MYEIKIGQTIGDAVLLRYRATGMCFESSNEIGDKASENSLSLWMSTPTVTVKIFREKMKKTVSSLVRAFIG